MNARNTRHALIAVLSVVLIIISCVMDLLDHPITATWIFFSAIVILGLYAIFVVIEHT